MNEQNKIFELHTIGVQTISDNAVLFIDDNTLVYGLSGNLIVYDIKDDMIRYKVFLCESMIKTISLINIKNCVIVLTENANIFIVDYRIGHIVDRVYLNLINNVYSIVLCNDDALSVISSHVICDSNTREIISQNDAMTIYNIKEKKVELSVESKNNFSSFINNKKVVSFKLINKKTTAYIYQKENEEWKINELSLQIDSEINRVKEYNDDYVIVQCYNRKMYFFNKRTLCIDFNLFIEGKGILGEFTFINNIEIIIADKPKRLVSFNPLSIAEKKEDKVDQNNSSIVLEDNNISGMNWGIAVKGNIITIANENGLFIYKDKKLLKANHNPLSLSGCGVAISSDNIIYGDLSGKLTLLNHNTNKYSVSIPQEQEMIRCITSCDCSTIVYYGTMMGSVCSYDLLLEIHTKILNLSSSVTCLRINSIYLISSDISGTITIIHIKLKTIVYSFKAHLPNPLNTDNNFGSLHLTAEIWSIATFPKTELNQSKDEHSLYIASGSEDKSIKVWNISLKAKTSNEVISMHDNTLAVTSLDWNINQHLHKEILISCSDDGTVNVYDVLSNFSKIVTLNIKKYIYGFFTLTYLSMCPSLPYIVITTQVGYVIIYDILKQKIAFIEKIHYGGIEGIAFDKSIIATCGNDCILNYIKINLNS